MKYKLKSNLVFHNLIRYLALSMAAATALISMLPVSLQKLMEEGNSNNIFLLIQQGTLVRPDYQFLFALLSMASPVLMAGLVFRFMYKNMTHSSVFHGVSRESLFLSNVFTSLVLILLPYFIAMAVTIFSPLEASFTPWLILKFFVIHLLYQLLFFSIALLVIVTVRSILIQGVYVTVLLLFPVMLYELITKYLAGMMYGCVIHLGVFGTLLKNTPVFRLLENRYDVSIWEGIITVCVTLLLFQWAMRIFIKKKPDKNQGFIRYDIARGFYRLLFYIFFAMVVIMVSKDSIFILLIYALAGAVLCELMVNGSLKLHSQLKVYPFLMVLLLIFFSVFRFDLYQVRSRKVAVNQVESIYVGTDYDEISKLQRDSAKKKLIYYLEPINLKKELPITPDLANRIINTQQQLIDKLPERESFPIYIAFRLKNGKILIRQYRFPYQEILYE